VHVNVKKPKFWDQAAAVLDTKETERERESAHDCRDPTKVTERPMAMITYERGREIDREREREIEISTCVWEGGPLGTRRKNTK
jgi:hypothetical protein